MPAPAAIAPLAWKAAQVGAAVALAIWAARGRRETAPRDVWRETALNGVAEGFDGSWGRREGEARLDAAGRWRRRVRAGRAGIEVDFAALARLRFRRL